MLHLNNYLEKSAKLQVTRIILFLSLNCKTEYIYNIMHYLVINTKRKLI